MREPLPPEGGLIINNQTQQTTYLTLPGYAF